MKKGFLNQPRFKGGKYWPKGTELILLGQKPSSCPNVVWCQFPNSENYAIHKKYIEFLDNENLSKKHKLTNIFK